MLLLRVNKQHHELTNVRFYYLARTLRPRLGLGSRRRLFVITLIKFRDNERPLVTIKEIKVNFSNWTTRPIRFCIYFGVCITD